MTKPLSTTTLALTAIASMLLISCPLFAQTVAPSEAVTPAVAPTTAAAVAPVAEFSWPAPPPSLGPVITETASTGTEVISAAPTDLPRPPPPPLRVTYSWQNESGATMKDAMDSLRVVKSEFSRNVVARQVFTNTALLLLTGGRSLNIQTFGKDNLVGVAPEGSLNADRLRNPAQAELTAELERQTTRWLAAQEKTRAMEFNRSLVVHSAAWRLIYNALDESDQTYRLTFDAGIYKSREKPSFITGNKQGGKSCKYESDARPMSEWQANDYQAVVDLAPVAVRQCATEFSAQLADLLELN